MQELVVESLVVSLTLVMLDVLVDDEAQMPLAERDDTMEALFFDRPDEPLGLDESPEQRRNGSTGRTLTVSSSKARMAHNRRLTFIRRGLIVALRGISCRYDSAQSR